MGNTDTAWTHVKEHTMSLLVSNETKRIRIQVKSYDGNNLTIRLRSVLTVFDSPPDKRKL